MLFQFGSGMAWPRRAVLIEAESMVLRNINFKSAISTKLRLPCRLYWCRGNSRSTGAHLHAVGKFDTKCILAATIAVGLIDLEEGLSRHRCGLATHFVAESEG